MEGRFMERLAESWVFFAVIIGVLAIAVIVRLVIIWKEKKAQQKDIH
jgi:hypothetical protein